MTAGRLPASYNAGSGQSAVRGEVAIVGMACTFPGARNLAQFWSNIVRGVDCISDAPPQRWDPQTYYDPHTDGRIYCKRGGYLGTSFTFNPLQCGIMPRAVEGAEPEQFLVLRTVYEALADAGHAGGSGAPGLPGERTAVLLGRGNYLGAGVTALVQRGMITEQTLRILRSLHPEFSPADIEAIRHELQGALPGFGPDVAPGLIPNIVSGRVANRLNLMGPTYTVDAACASSLIATEIAVRGLLTGQFDAVLAGGVHLFADVSFLQVFCAMGALSRSSVIRPFDADCDGTITGEGVGILVFKRLADAERDGDRIYAVIKGVGSSSDGKAMGVTAPRVEGEVLALRRAYEMAGVSPQTVGLIEAHGTGTPIGDATELEALRTVFGGSDAARGQSVALGSVKSMIGHAMPAAGAAALIKTALSLYHGVLPATLNCKRPHELLRREHSRFYVNTRTRPWVHGGEHPRRAGVNAFGFGGVNAHVVLEEHRSFRSDEAMKRRSGEGEEQQRDPGIVGSRDRGGTLGTSQSRKVEKSPPRAAAAAEWDCELVVIRASDRAGLIAELARVREYVVAAVAVELRDLAYTLNCSVQDRPSFTAHPEDHANAVGRGAARCEHCVAIVASSAVDLEEKLEFAANKLADANCKQIKDAKGIYYLHESSARGGKVAFVFPGLGAQYVDLMADLCLSFPLLRDCFDQADRAMTAAIGAPLSAYVFPPPAFTESEQQQNELRLAAIERANPAVMTANGAMYLLLSRLGIAADMMTGHSSGEWVVLPAAGMVDIGAFVAGMSRLGEMWRQLGENAAVPEMVMLAVGTDRETVARLAAEIERPIVVANDNCKHQVVVVVAPDTADLVMSRLRSRGVFVERLPYRNGYHTPEFGYVTNGLREYFRAMELRPANVKLYSCTTAKPYPTKREEIVELLAHTFARPLLFRDTVEAMYADGARIFVEVGPRGNLTAFVDDILRGRPHAAMATNQHRKSGLAALQNALAQLAALHVPMDLTALYEGRAARKLSWEPQIDRPEDEAEAPGAMQVSLCCAGLQLAPRELPPQTSALGSELASAPVKTEESAAVHTGETPVPHEVRANPGAPGLFSQENGGTQIQHRPHDVELVMHQHFRLMETFVQSNEEIMRAFLSAGVQAAALTTEARHAHTHAEFSPIAPQETKGSRDEGTEGSRDKGIDDVRALAGDTGWSAEALVGPVTPPVRTPSPTAGPTISPPANATDANGLESVLLSIVSERTGYPPEMLDLDADMEADLGIDSIKRVEILGALQQGRAAAASSGEIDMEEVAKLKTLRQIVAFLNNKVQANPASAVVAKAVSNVSPSAAAMSPSTQSPGTAATMRPDAAAAVAASGPVKSDIQSAASRLSFAGMVVEHVPGQKVVLRRPVNVEHDLYLHDHCFDPYISDVDPQRERLCIVPLTVSLEMMAEVATLLESGRRCVAAKNITAGKWVEVEPGGPKVEIEITATRREADQIHVAVRNLTGTESGGTPTQVAEGSFVFAGAYPAPPPPQSPELKAPRTPRHTAEQMYDQRRMFHGPRFRGVAAIERVGEDGLSAQLQILPTVDLLAGDSSPRFIFDPFLLDAAGQLVGYWPVEYLSEGFVLFPIRVHELTLYQDNLRPGGFAECRLRIVNVSKRQLRADLDVLAPDGTLWMRITGWEDWRFYWEPDFYNFWRYPNEGVVSRRLELPAVESDVECRRMEPFGEMGSSMWENLWAHLICGRRELEQYRAMKDGARRTEWIFGRAAAKDAVRMWVRRHFGLALYPADVEITQDEHAKPSAAGFWTRQIGTLPQLSIAHKGPIAVAVAGRGAVGVDLETVAARDPGFANIAFTGEEQSLIARQNGSATRDEWLTRAWCAKEAAGKAAGNGLGHNPRSLRVVQIAPDGQMVVAGNPQVVGASAAEHEYVVRSFRDGDFIIALALCERSSGAAVES